MRAVLHRTAHRTAAVQYCCSTVCGDSGEGLGRVDDRRARLFEHSPCGPSDQVSSATRTMMSSIVRLLGALSSAIGECSIEGLPAGSRVTSRGVDVPRNAARQASGVSEGRWKFPTATNSTMLNHHSSRVEEWQGKRSCGPSGMWLRCRMRQVNLECLLRGLHAELAPCAAVTLNMTENKEASTATSIECEGG